MARVILTTKHDKETYTITAQGFDFIDSDELVHAESSVHNKRTLCEQLQVRCSIETVYILSRVFDPECGGTEADISRNQILIRHRADAKVGKFRNAARRVLQEHGHKVLFTA